MIKEFQQMTCVNISIIDCEEARKIQLQAVSAKKSGILKNDIVFILEHQPVFTLGKSGGIENLKISKNFLANKGIKVLQTERGGNITYHGPGQLVSYPIIDLNKAHLNIKDYVNMLEEIMIKTAADFGVKASGHPKNRGIWVGENKLGSLGIRVSRGITYHGIALNVNLSLKPFQWINPCGLDNVQMTSIQNETGCHLNINQVRESLMKNIEKIFNKKLVKTSLEAFKFYLPF